MSSHPDQTSVQRKIENADDYSRNGQNGCGDVGIDELVHIVEQKSSLVRLDASLSFEPVLEHSQRTRPRKQFRKNSPQKGNDMQPAKGRARTSQQSSEDHPHNEQRMQQEDGNCERRIETRSCRHS